MRIPVRAVRWPRSGGALAAFGRCVGRVRAVRRLLPGYSMRSTIVAIPCPTPMHIVASP